jgi:hypothetical protein
MARTKASEDDGVVGPMDEKTFKSFLKKLDLAQAAVEDAADETKTKRSVLSALWKEFKKAGGKPDTMREVMRLRTMEEGDLLQYIEDRDRYAGWLKLPIGVQASLFDEPIEEPAEEDVEAAAPEPATRQRKSRGPKLVDAPNVTGSPLN